MSKLKFMGANGNVVSEDRLTELRRLRAEYKYAWDVGQSLEDMATETCECYKKLWDKKIAVLSMPGSGYSEISARVAASADIPVCDWDFFEEEVMTANLVREEGESVKNAFKRLKADRYKEVQKEAWGNQVEKAVRGEAYPHINGGKLASNEELMKKMRDNGWKFLGVSVKREDYPEHAKTMIPISSTWADHADDIVEFANMQYDKRFEALMAAADLVVEREAGESISNYIKKVAEQL